jgi:hypothetical protein
MMLLSLGLALLQAGLRSSRELREASGCLYSMLHLCKAGGGLNAARHERHTEQSANGLVLASGTRRRFCHACVQRTEGLPMGLPGRNKALIQAGAG